MSHYKIIINNNKKLKIIVYIKNNSKNDAFTS